MKKYFIYLSIILVSCTKESLTTSNISKPNIADSWEQSKGTETLNIQSLICVGSYSFSGGSTGIMRSIDLGGNFNVSNTGNSDITPTRGFTNDGNQIFNCTGKGVFTSTDFGANWISKSNGLTNLLNSGIIYVSPYLFVVTPTGVFSSFDKGNNWISAGLINTDVRCISSIGNTIFVGTNGSGVYKSSDWGKTWTQINNGLSTSNVRAIESKGNTLFVGGEIGTSVFRSTNEGANWTQLSGGLPTGSYRGFASNLKYIVAGSFGAGVYYSSDNGDNWTQINSGLKDLSIFDLAFNDKYLIAGTNTQGVFRFDINNLK